MPFFADAESNYELFANDADASSRTRMLSKTMNQIESNAKRDKKVIILDYIFFFWVFPLLVFVLCFFLVHQMQYRETTQQQQQIKK